MMATGTMPELWALMREAFVASEACDNFDVHSEDPESLAEFVRLRRAEGAAMRALMEHMMLHELEIKQEIRDE